MADQRASRRLPTVTERPEGLVYQDALVTEDEERELVAAFADAGWSWGGTWANPDYQHFSATGN